MHAFVICTDNRDYSAALEKKKLYENVPDPEAKKYNQIRVMDASGEDCVFPLQIFLRVPLPEEVADRVAKTA